MKILYDHQIFQHQRFGGISRYFTEIIMHLPDTVDRELSVLYAFNEYLKNTGIDFQFEEQLLNFANQNFKGKQRIVPLLERYLPNMYPNRLAMNKENTIRKLEEGLFDIFHPTLFEDYYLEYLNGKPYVLTIHDMIIELYPEFINSPGFIARKKKLADGAAHIIAVSENTKNDIVDVFNISPDKISVVYHGSSLKEGKSDIELPTKYILYIGDRRLGYKNFAFFITSLKLVLNENPDLKVLCTGDDFTLEEKAFLKALGLDDQVEHRFVADEDLYTVYNKAKMFVYPSYYEGFGIPILEAFQADCPVVLADASCFKEVAGDAALYFDPKSVNQLQNRVRTLLRDEELAKNLKEKGKVQLENYSWANSAAKTVEIYKHILEK